MVEERVKEVMKDFKPDRAEINAKVKERMAGWKPDPDSIKIAVDARMATWHWEPDKEAKERIDRIVTERLKDWKPEPIQIQKRADEIMEEDLAEIKAKVKERMAGWKPDPDAIKIAVDARMATWHWEPDKESKERIDRIVAERLKDWKPDSNQIQKRTDEIMKEAKIKAEKEAATTKATEEARLKDLEEARMKGESGAAMAKAGEEARVNTEAEADAKAAEESKIKAEEEAAAKLAEDVKVKKEEAAKAGAVHETTVKTEERALVTNVQDVMVKTEEDTTLKVLEEARAQAEANIATIATEEARVEEVNQAKIRAAEEVRIMAEAHASATAAEKARLKAEEEAAAKAAEEVRVKMEEDAKAGTVQEAMVKAEEEILATKVQEAMVETEENTKFQAMEAARAQAEEEHAVIATEEARVKAVEQAKGKVVEEVRIMAEAHALAIAAEEAKHKAEEEEATAKAAQEANVNIEQEAKVNPTEVARLRTEEHITIRATEEATIKTKEYAKAKAAEEARAKEEKAVISKADGEATAKAAEVKLGFIIQNVDFDAMTETHKAEMISGIKATVASNAGVPENNIVVALSAGSVVADVTITVPDHVVASTLNATVNGNQAAITAAVVSHAGSIAGLPSTGAISVTGFMAKAEDDAWTLHWAALRQAHNNFSTDKILEGAGVNAEAEADYHALGDGRSKTVAETARNIVEEARVNTEEDASFRAAGKAKILEEEKTTSKRERNADMSEILSGSIQFAFRIERTSQEEKWGFQLCSPFPRTNAIVIKDVHEGGLASEQSQLSCGDMLMSVNETRVVNMTNKEVIKMIKGALVVDLVVARGDKLLASYQSAAAKIQARESAAKGSEEVRATTEANAKTKAAREPTIQEKEEKTAKSVEASAPKVKLGFSIQNVEFGAMTEMHKAEMTSGIKATVASNAGVAENNIVVALSAGSVAVDVTIAVPDQADVSALKNAVDEHQSIFTSSVVSTVVAIAGLPTVGAISVSGFTVKVTGRELLIREAFDALDLDDDGQLCKSEMRVFGDATGFKGTEIEWAKEFRDLCREGLRNPEEGIDFKLFFKLVEDDSENGCYCTDAELRQMIYMGATKRKPAEVSAPPQLSSSSDVNNPPRPAPEEEQDEGDARVRPAPEEAKLSVAEEAKIKASEEMWRIAEAKARATAEHKAWWSSSIELRVKAEEEATLQAEEEAMISEMKEARKEAIVDARFDAVDEARALAEEEEAKKNRGYGTRLSVMFRRNSVASRSVTPTTRSSNASRSLTPSTSSD